MQLPLILERPFRHERGNCCRVKLPGGIVGITDTEARPAVCPLEILEDGVRLGPAHSAHADIANIGLGRYSAWQDGWLYFSSSDNVDPNENGRTYKLDLSERRPLADGNDDVSPAVREIVSAARELPAEFTPLQAYAAIRRGLDVLQGSCALAKQNLTGSTGFATIFW